MVPLPTGTITFLFADVEGSTRLLHELGGRYAEVLGHYRQLLRSALETHGGQEVDTQGDAFFVAFTQAKDALSAALETQQSILRHDWPNGTELRVRMGLHTGEPLRVETGYVGIDVNRAARICASGHGGQILLSQTTADLVESNLPAGVTLRDLGAHRLKDLLRPERIYQLTYPDLPADFPSLKSIDAFPNNLPVQLTSFIGREREITQIKQILNASRLITLTGAGGSGKSRLALQVAAERLNDFTNGVWIVELASLSDPSLVPQAVASVLNAITHPGREILATLIDSLQRKHLLLILDNCEHLLEACANFADSVLRRCSQLRILATSREALGIDGERTFQTPTMSLPPPTDLPSIEGLQKYEAIRLFVDRAGWVQRDFRITADNATAVAHVCRHLDGIPLAIELAAARVNVLSPREIAARLDDRFRLLVGGSRNTLPRHQTLQATMDWSYSLLSIQEQVLFRRLSIFTGGFALEAAEAICSGADMNADEVLILLAQLANKSLVAVEMPEMGTRYRMLETVRQYGRDKLLKSGEGSKVQRRHYDWYLALAEKAESQLAGPEQASWLERLEIEHDNLRTALDWSMKEPNAENGLRLAASLGTFWHRRNYWREGREWLEKAITMSAGTRSFARVKSLRFAGMFAFYLGDNRSVEPLLEESLTLAKGLGDKQAIAESLLASGIIAGEKGDVARGTALLEESLDIFKEVGNKPRIASVLANLGVGKHFRRQNGAVEMIEESLALAREIGHIAVMAQSLGYLGRAMRQRGEYQRSRELLEESSALFKRLGDKGHVAFALLHLGHTLWHQGNVAQAATLFKDSQATFEEIEDREGIATAKLAVGCLESVQGNHNLATTLIEESLVLYRGLGVKWGVGLALRDLGVVAREKGDFESAKSLLKESLALQRQLAADMRTIAVTLQCLAGVAARRDVYRAAKLFGAAEAIDPTPGVSAHPFYDRCYQRDVELVQSALSGQAFTAAWAEGRAMTVEQAMEYALSEKD